VAKTSDDIFRISGFVKFRKRLYRPLGTNVWINGVICSGAARKKHWGGGENDVTLIDVNLPVA